MRASRNPPIVQRLTGNSTNGNQNRSLKQDIYKHKIADIRYDNECLHADIRYDNECLHTDIRYDNECLHAFFFFFVLRYGAVDSNQRQLHLHSMTPHRTKNASTVQ